VAEGAPAMGTFLQTEETNMLRVKQNRKVEAKMWEEIIILHIAETMGL
jgi:hypothetical protein